MKKIIFGLLLLFAVSTKSSAQTDTSGTRYWYYPEYNYYYNDLTGDYWYYDESTTRWIDVKKLPGTYRIMATDDRYPVYYKGNDVWKENKKHKVKYKQKKDGTIKEKPSGNKP